MPRRLKPRKDLRLPRRRTRQHMRCRETRRAAIFYMAVPGAVSRRGV